MMYYRQSPPSPGIICQHAPPPTTHARTPWNIFLLRRTARRNINVMLHVCAAFHSCCITGKVLHLLASYACQLHLPPRTRGHHGNSPGHGPFQDFVKSYASLLHLPPRTREHHGIYFCSGARPGGILMLCFMSVQHFIHVVLPAKSSISWHHMPASSTSHHAREDTMETRQATDHFKTSLIESCRVPLPAQRLSFRLTFPANTVRGSCTHGFGWERCVARTAGIDHPHTHTDM